MAAAAETAGPAARAAALAGSGGLSGDGVTRAAQGATPDFADTGGKGAASAVTADKAATVPARGQRHQGR